jgi:hypothetical protein
MPDRKLRNLASGSLPLLTFLKYARRPSFDAENSISSTNMNASITDQKKGA